MKVNVLCLLMFIAILGQACRAEDLQATAPIDSGTASSDTYSAPDNAFTVKIPTGWKVQREEKDGGYLTVITRVQYRAANISILTINSHLTEVDTSERKSHLLVETSKSFFPGWIGGLEEQARVEGTGRIYPTLFAGREALRTDVTYYRDDAEDPRLGYSVFLIGKQKTFFISVTGSQSRFKDLENIVSTIRIEP